MRKNGETAPVDVDSEQVSSTLLLESCIPHPRPPRSRRARPGRDGRSFYFYLDAGPASAGVAAELAESKEGGEPGSDRAAGRKQAEARAAPSDERQVGGLVAALVCG